MTNEHDRAHHAAQELLAKRTPAGAVFSRAALPESGYPKARLFSFTRAYGAARTSAFEHRERLKEAAGLIAGFGAFRQWCLEDIKAAWLEDRQQGTRQAQNRRLAWQHLFKHFARLHKIERALKIEALDRQGNYRCELVEKSEPNRWEQLLRLGRTLGIPAHKLRSLENEYRNAAVPHAAGAPTEETAQA
jgi:hypothetical protein